VKRLEAPTDATTGTSDPQPLSRSATYVNTGDWLSHRNYAVYNPADQSLKLYDLQRGEVAGY